jgi:DNA-directed RNA polymerase subunit RPC12/RpoP
MMTRNLLIKCPHSGLNVQCRLDVVDDEGEGDDRYQAVECPVCGSSHFINEKTGRVLGQRYAALAGAP